MGKASRRYISAGGQVLGRLASRLAALVSKDGSPASGGVSRPVVVVGLGNIRLSGSKLTSKVYHRHSGFPGGLKQVKLSDRMKLEPSWALLKAVSGMLPKNRLRGKMLRAILLA